ncbi:MAG: S8 family serine peptidase [Bacteroidia bacterium]|nr:S8 family serine peptidase [Bacteroidia bacterium]
MTIKKLLFSIFTGIILLSSNKVSSQTVDSSYIDGMIYVKVKSSDSFSFLPYLISDSSIKSLYLTYDIDTIYRPFPGLDSILDKTWCIKFNNKFQVDALMLACMATNHMEYVEKPRIYHTFFTPNDVNGQQWYLNKIEAAAAWDISQGSTTVTVAIVDNAVNINHEDLAPNIWTNPGEIPGNGFDDDLNGYTDDINGFDVADNDNNPNPPGTTTTSSPFIHGTHCAGLASASTNNGKGIASIGFKVKIIPVKCTRNSETGSTLTNAYDGVYYAIKVNADVISMSWGGPGESSITNQNLLNSAHNRGIILCAAAGNDNSENPNFPAAYNNVISVGASDQSDKKSSFSNFGSTIDVLAPGSGIYSTLAGSNTAYGNLSGTSMACPLTAGLCALILSFNPSLSPDQVENFLKTGCDNVNSANTQFAGKIGSGRINARRSLQFAAGITGIEETAKGNIGVYPVPNNGTFTVEWFDENLTSIDVYNTMGDLVYSTPVSENTGTVQIKTNLAPGIYMLTAKGFAGNYNRKIIVY